MDILGAMATADARKLQNVTFLALFLGAGYFLWRTMEPIWLPIFLGLIIAVSVNPLHQKLRKKWRNHDGLSAAVLTAAVLVLSAAMVAFLFAVVGERIVEFAREASKRYQSRGAAGLMPHDALPLLEKLGVDPSTVREHVGRAAETVAGSMGRLLAALVAGTFSGVFTLIFTALTSYYLLVEGERATRWLVDMMPLPDSQVWELARNFRDVTRTMLLGTGVTAFYQGASAFVGYWLFGVPDAIVWASLTGVASLLPGIGTLLVWVPVGGYLLASGSIGKGIGLLAWGSVVIVLVADYVLRPWLVKAKLRMNDLLVFIAIFGGIEAFGVVGLILGPIFVALFVSLLRIYQREYRPRPAALHKDDRPKASLPEPLERPAPEERAH
jgi:predicted PurR-regulated permease PerM